MKVAVTGATSDFGAAILPVLLADPDIDTVIGLGRRELRLEHPKLESVRMDIRDPGIEDVFRGCEAVVHLAFVVEEIRDKTATHDINLRGSRNVIDSAYRAGALRVVIASSINAYGPELRPKPVNEDVYPAGDPDRYYFHDKAEVEHYAEWWLRRHPGEMAISMLRPTYIIGPDFSNDGIDQLTGPVGAFPRADEAAYQFLHQRDMADAFHRAVKQDLVGPFNLGPRDWVGVRELAAMQGQRMFDVPERPAVVAANIAFRLGLTAFSGQWVTAGETVVDSTRLTEATGWAPTLTARESAAVMILLQGKVVWCAGRTRWNVASPARRRWSRRPNSSASTAADSNTSRFPRRPGPSTPRVHAAQSGGAATVKVGRRSHREVGRRSHRGPARATRTPRTVSHALRRGVGGERCRRRRRGPARARVEHGEAWSRDGGRGERRPGGCSRLRQDPVRCRTARGPGRRRDRARVAAGTLAVEGRPARGPTRRSTRPTGCSRAGCGTRVDSGTFRTRTPSATSSRSPAPIASPRRVTRRTRGRSEQE